MSVVTTTLCIQRAIHFCLVLFFFPFIHSFTYFSFIHFFYIPITASPPSLRSVPPSHFQPPAPAPLSLSVREGGGLPRMSSHLGISSCSQTKQHLLLLRVDTEAQLGGKDQRQATESEIAPVPAV